MGAWINQIGLRNPGIDWLIQRAQRGKMNLSDKILSIHGFDDQQWELLLQSAQTLSTAALELNMSCPNVGEITWPAHLFDQSIATGVPVLVKLPPVNFEQMVDHALSAGVRAFHCCNTIPVPRGGISGKPLKPFSIQCIRRVLDLAQQRAIDDLVLIGGGGITTPRDIDDYAAAGATHVAVGTKAMNPLRLVSEGPLRGLIDHAGRIFGSPEAVSVG